LFLGTNSENILDSVKKGLFPIGSRQYASKLTEESVAKILKLKDSSTHQDIASMFDVTRGTISQIFQGKTWKHVKRPLPQ
jgi:CRP-like cAMP-binding protein